MNRRLAGCFYLSLFAGPWLGLHSDANALTLNDITNTQASQGLKLALERGAIAAVNTLGQANGFLGNDKVRIPLPGYLQDAANLLRNFG